MFLAKPGPEAGPRLRAPEQILGPEHAGTAGEWGPYMFSMPIPEFKDLIQKWVETPREDGGKRRDERDAGKSEEQIADYVTGVMLASNRGAQEARRRLLPHILGWLGTHREAQGLDPRDPPSSRSERDYGGRARAAKARPSPSLTLAPRGGDPEIATGEFLRPWRGWD